MESYSVRNLLVPFSCSLPDYGWSLWSDLDQVTFYPNPTVSHKSNQHSPAPEVPQPFSLISSNLQDIQAMQRAEQNPRLVVLSDWGHLTSMQYQQVQVDSRLNVM